MRRKYAIVDFRLFKNHDKYYHTLLSHHSYEQNIRHILPKEETNCVVWVKLVSGCAKQLHIRTSVVNHSFVFDSENNNHCKLDISNSES